jgi:hypothetical protein
MLKKYELILSAVRGVQGDYEELFGLHEEGQGNE